MAQGWHGDSAGHARAGRLGGQKSAAARRNRTLKFGEKIIDARHKTKSAPSQRGAKRP